MDRKVVEMERIKPMFLTPATPATKYNYTAMSLSPLKSSMSSTLMDSLDSGTSSRMVSGMASMFEESGSGASCGRSQPDTGSPPHLTLLHCSPHITTHTTTTTTTHHHCNIPGPVAGCTPLVAPPVCGSSPATSTPATWEDRKAAEGLVRAASGGAAKKRRKLSRNPIKGKIGGGVVKLDSAATKRRVRETDAEKVRRKFEPAGRKIKPWERGLHSLHPSSSEDEMMGHDNPGKYMRGLFDLPRGYVQDDDEEEEESKPKTRGNKNKDS